MVRLAPLVFVLLWSSSFVAARIGLRSLTPLLFVAVRMVLAAAVLVGVMLALGRSWRSVPAPLVHCAVRAYHQQRAERPPTMPWSTSERRRLPWCRRSPIAHRAAGLAAAGEQLRPLQWPGWC